MGFTDLLTSSRGPGVIGTLLALLVLVGFGTLYMFVFDEGMQGGKITIEAEVRNQARDIETHKDQIENFRKRMEEAVRFKAQAKEADELRARAEIDLQRIAELNAAKEQADAAIQGAVAAWEKYKDDYRASEWAFAEGEKLADIKTATGDTYANVVISKVDHTGMRISHSAGSKTIPPQDLPPELHDRFQFSEEKTAQVRVKIDKDFEDLSSNVEIATLATSGKDKLAKKYQLEQEIVAANTKIQGYKSAEPGLLRQVEGIRLELAEERAKAAHRANRGGQGINRTPQIQARLRGVESKISTNRRSIADAERTIRDNKRDIGVIEREVAQIKIDIAKLKEELEKKKAVAQP